MEAVLAAVLLIGFPGEKAGSEQAEAHRDVAQVGDHVRTFQWRPGGTVHDSTERSSKSATAGYPPVADLAERRRITLMPNFLAT